MANLSNLLTEFKKWLDGDEAQVIEQESAPVRREWEEFLIQLAREVENVMQREMFTPPGGPTYIPPEYLVFLSREDDAQWQGAKREGLERGLNYVLSERVTELIGQDEVQTQSFGIELRVDGSLEKGQFRVQPVWDTSSPKTEVRPRKAVRTEEVDDSQSASAAADDDEKTRVRPRSALFTVAIKREGLTEMRDFYQPRITIGRGSKDFVVDLKLDGDLEISRKQAVIEKVENGYSIQCEGRNPIEVGGRELVQGEHAEIDNGGAIRIGTYELKVGPRAQIEAEIPEQQRE